MPFEPAREDTLHDVLAELRKMNKLLAEVRVTVYSGGGPPTQALSVCVEGDR